MVRMAMFWSKGYRNVMSAVKKERPLDQKSIAHWLRRTTSHKSYYLLKYCYFVIFSVSSTLYLHQKISKIVNFQTSTKNVKKMLSTVTIGTLKTAWKNFTHVRPVCHFRNCLVKKYSNLAEKVPILGEFSPSKR